VTSAENRKTLYDYKPTSKMFVKFRGHFHLKSYNFYPSVFETLMCF